MNTSIDNQLWELEKICTTNENQFAKWVLYAIARYISTGRSTKEFDKAFCQLSKNRLETMVNKCLKHGLSDNEIMDNVLKYIKINVAA